MGSAEMSASKPIADSIRGFRTVGSIPPERRGVARHRCREANDLLGVQRIELLVESIFCGDAGVDGTTDGPDRRRFHDRTPASNRSPLSLSPKKRGPFHLVPVIAKATLERLS